MKRLNPKTNKPFKFGDTREDGYHFQKYQISAKVKKDGYYIECWLSPQAFIKARESSKTQVKKWRVDNREKFNAYARAQKKKYPEKQAEITAKRRAKKLSATPKWLTKPQNKQIYQTYAIAAALTTITGVRHVVDHVIPLQHQLVCGLHVPWNLQVLTESENASKSNNITI